MAPATCRSFLKQMACLLFGSFHNEIRENFPCGKFFIHGTRHGLGIDTHDPGNYDVLRPGVVFTIEPGVYIPENTEGIDRKYWNIGVRIDDDILVTETGYKLMSPGVPREINEIEKLMRK